MIIPVRCFTCNRILASKYEKYLEIVNTEKDTEKDQLVGCFIFTKNGSAQRS